MSGHSSERELTTPEVEFSFIEHISVTIHANPSCFERLLCIVCPPKHYLTSDYLRLGVAFYLQILVFLFTFSWHYYIQWVSNSTNILSALCVPGILIVSFWSSLDLTFLFLFWFKLHRWPHTSSMQFLWTSLCRTISLLIEVYTSFVRILSSIHFI